MSDEKLRVGVIGIGWWAIVRHVPNLRKTGRAEVVSIARRNVKALAQAKEVLGVTEAYTDWRELLDRSQLDAVVVSTSHNAHVEPTLAALERGLHVLVEKPMTLKSADAWKMVRAAERGARVLMIGYNARCRGAWRSAAQALKEGACGIVRQVNLAVSYNLRWIWEQEDLVLPEWLQQSIEAHGVTEVFGPDLNTYWRRNPAEMGGGEFADTGSHWVDMALWFGGAPPVEVVAFAETAGLPVECYLGVQARLANGVLLSLASSDGVPAGGNRLTVYGELGTLTADWRGWGTPEIWLHRAGGSEELAIEIPDSDPDAAFVSTVLDGAPNLAPAQDGAYAVALTEAVYRSVTEKWIVRVDLPQHP